MAKKTGNFWGGGNTSKEYLMMLAGANPISKPSSLAGHSFSNFNVDQIDRVTAVGVEFRRGQLVEVQRVLRPARQTQVTFTVGFGSFGEAWTPLLQRVRKGNCEENLYMKRLCAADDQFAHFYAILNTIFNPPTFVNDLITVDDTTNVVTQQSEGAAPEMRLVWNVGASRIADVVPPLYAVAFMTEECPECEDASYQNFLIGGGAGGPTDDAYLAKTSDRFGNVTVLTTGIADGNTVKGIYTDGDIIAAAFADDPDPTVAATGGVAFSTDAGDSFVLDSGITEAVADVNFFDGQYIAVGGDGGAGGKIWVSDDGTNWTEVTSVAIPAAQQFTSIAVDVANEVFYVSGSGGTLLRGTKSGSVINLEALTPTGVSTTDLFRVAVMGDDHVAVGGASNYYAESFDGGETWSNPGIPGSGSVKGIAGISFIRAAVGAGTIIADRTILTDNNYKTKTVLAGITITGDFTDVKGIEGESDYFIGVTDDGEVVLLKPFHPNA